MSLLRESEQGIELGQIRQVHDDRRRGRKFRTRLRQREHRLDGELVIARQQHTQCIIDGDLAGVRRVMQDLQIVLGARGVRRGLRRTGRKRCGTASSGTGRRDRRSWRTHRLAHQRIDDMPIVHRVLVATDQARQRIDVPIGVPDLNAIGEQLGFHLFTDEAAVHRVRVAMDVDQAAGIDPASHLQTRRQAIVGQVAQCLPFLGEAILSASVPRQDQLLQEVRVLLAAGEVATAAE